MREIIYWSLQLQSPLHLQPLSDTKNMFKSVLCVVWNAWNMQGKVINSTNMLLLYGIKHSTGNNNYVPRRRRFTGKISQYLCKSPINLWLRLNPNSLQSTHVNILETNFDDKLVSKRKLFNNYPPTTKWIYICYLPAGRYVWWKTMTSGVKMLPEAP